MLETIKNDAHAWGVVMAGGEGSRLQPLTRLITGDNRPKQFCPIFGGETLLAQTRARIASALALERTLFVVTQAHEHFYTGELGEIDPVRLVVQPSNRGTAAAILYSVLRISRLDRDAIVAFFPADHYYSDQSPLVAAIESAFEVARENDRSVVLLGAKPQHPEVEYGWIEPGAEYACRLGNCSRVNRFLEKPSLQSAQDLMQRGGLWNTFVMVGRLRAFLAMIQSKLPHVFQAFERIAGYGNPQLEVQRARHLYQTLDPADFSRRVLTASTKDLLVLHLGDSGWSDLGRPEWVMATLELAGIETGWRRVLVAGA